MNSSFEGRILHDFLSEEGVALSTFWVDDVEARVCRIDRRIRKIHQLAGENGGTIGITINRHFIPFFCHGDDLYYYYDDKYLIATITQDKVIWRESGYGGYEFLEWLRYTGPARVTRRASSKGQQHKPNGENL
jgi:hypothetical protein